MVEPCIVRRNIHGADFFDPGVIRVMADAADADHGPEQSSGRAPGKPIRVERWIALQGRSPRYSKAACRWLPRTSTRMRIRAALAIWRR